MNVVDIVHTTKRFHTLNVKFTEKELEILNTGRYNMEISPSLNKRFDYRNDSNYVDSLVSIILAYFELSISDVRINNRGKTFVNTRMFLSYYLRKLTNLTYEQIGSLLNRDHASIIHMVKRFKTEILYRDTQRFKNELDELISTINVN